jgi:hypothetical protein
LRDHLQKKKSLIDEEHVAYMKALLGHDEEEALAESDEEIVVGSPEETVPTAEVR